MRLNGGIKAAHRRIHALGWLLALSACGGGGIDAHSGSDLTNNASSNVAHAEGGTTIAKASSISTIDVATSTNSLAQGVNFGVGGRLDSSNGQYHFYFQADGNLVLRDQNSKTVWASATNGKGGVRLNVQRDGNLVLYTPAGSAVWATNTVGSGASYLIVQNNGSLALSTASGKAVWSTAAGSGSTDTGSVLPTDTVLLPPVSNGPTLGTITAYNWHSLNDWPSAQFERPIYNAAVIERNNDDYWNRLVDELLLSRVNVVMLHGRGCSDLVSGMGGAGDECPRWLTKFVSAVQRAGAQDVIKVGMWDDTGSYPNSAGVSRLDLSNHANWSYFWDHNIKIWFDTLPKSMWYLMDGKPVIAEWSGSSAFFSHQQGNMSAMINWLKSQFKARYGLDPAFILQKNWSENDSTITPTQATGEHDWFTPKSDIESSNHSYYSYNGAIWGATVPGFRDRGTLPGCGIPCREVTRRNGASLDSALAQGANAKFILLEGWSDMAESAGYYRSAKWRYPTQYINIVRRYADPTPATLRFQAEGADTFFNRSNANLGGAYSDRALSVGKLNDNAGWYVGWINAGDWIQYQEVELGSGTYRFTVRAATNAIGKKMHMEVDGIAMSSIEMPNTGSLDTYQLAHLGEIPLGAGPHTLRLVFESSGGLNVDWFFLKRK